MNAAYLRARVRRTIAVFALAATGAALALAASSAAQAAAVGKPTAAHTASRNIQPDATPPSHTIAGAEQLTLGDEETGGGAHVDFWLVKLTGGDQMQLSVQEPNSGYDFNLYAPGTTDSEFGTATPLTIASTNGQAQDYITLQAPYTGTFILAVCENSANQDCSNTDSGYGTNPMNPYTFTPTLTGNACGSNTSGEVQAGATIAAASQFTVGNCQTGGGSHVDFWRVHLIGGQQVKLGVQEPNASYDFNLYAPGTTDSGFGAATPVDIAATNNQAQDYITLQAPYTGTFVLAVCENSANQDCSYTDSGYGTNPMNPYAFTTSGGPGTTTSLKLSASSVTYGKEKALKLTATVRARFSSAHPAGTVTIKAGKKTICTVKLSGGKGTCSPTSQKLLAVGTYHVVASYGGSKTFKASASKAVTLKVKR